LKEILFIPSKQNVVLSFDVKFRFWPFSNTTEPPQDYSEYEVFVTISDFEYDAYGEADLFLKVKSSLKIKLPSKLLRTAKLIPNYNEKLRY
jgi:hypothetical protein